MDVKIDCYQQFQSLFNRGEFYEAHEVLESEWKRERGPTRLFLQGLILLSGACVHAQKKNWIEASKMAQLARDRLDESKIFWSEQNHNMKNFIDDMIGDPESAFLNVPEIHVVKPMPIDSP